MNLSQERKQKEKLNELKIVCPGIFKSVLSNIALIATCGFLHLN